MLASTAYIVATSSVLAALAQMGASVHDLIDYNEKEDEIPFAAPITEFPVVRPRRSPPSFADRNEQPPAYIPPHLPAFPDAHTHRATAVLPGAPKDAAQKRAAIVKAKRSAEQSLARQARAIQPSDTAGQNLLAADLRWEDAAQDTARRCGVTATRRASRHFEHQRPALHPPPPTFLSFA